MDNESAKMYILSTRCIYKILPGVSSSENPNDNCR